MKVGLDIGGTKTAAVAVDAAGDVVAGIRIPTGWGASAVVRSVVDAVAALAVEPAIAGRSIESVGIGIPGQVHAVTGRVAHAVNLGVDDLELAAAVEPELGVPVRVENDVKAAAVGAYALHGGSGSMAYLNLGTGIAAGVVSDGRLWRGPRGAAGEVGHVSIDPRGPECRCGQRGCIESFAGGAAVARRWGKPSAYPVRDVFDAADAGDAAATEIRAGLVFGVAAAVRVLVLTCDVDVVVLGGGVTGLGHRLLDAVRDDLEGGAASSAFMTSLGLARRVELLPSGSPAAALGAALIGSSPTPEEGVDHG